MRMGPQLKPLVTAGILHDPAAMPEARHELFEPDYWLARHAASVAAGGRGNVLFIDDGQHQWVLRHYRRGGLIGKLINDQYLWLGAGATRSFREWRLLAQLRALDLPVPAPVAARHVRSGLGYRADLLTATIPGACTLAQRLAQISMPAADWQRVGQTLARFHAAGVHHADLNANNIVFDERQTVWVLDLDRGRIRTVESEWINAVLARLLRSLNKLHERRGIHFQMDDWRQLLQAHDVRLNELLVR